MDKIKFSFITGDLFYSYAVFWVFLRKVIVQGSIRSVYWEAIDIFWDFNKAPYAISCYKGKGKCYR